MSRPASQAPYNKRASSGSTYSFILEHVFSYPGSYKFLERDPASSGAHRHTMAANIPSPRTPVSTVSSKSSVKAYPSKPAVPARCATAEFTSGVMSQVGQSPSQPGSLPIVFINSFLRRCFTIELENVDFPQALTALDHLADLELRRRRQMNAALARLGVTRENLPSDAENLAKKYPSIATWVGDVQPSERKVEALYTQLYVGLRRWILINELSLVPFHKHNCHAMLNILFPPSQSSDSNMSPTQALTPSVLHKQRECYLAYLKAVENRGPQVLLNLIDQNKRPGEESGWPAVRETLDNYLRVTIRLIDEADAIGDWGAFNDHPDQPKHQRGSSWSVRGRRETADSGVSFTSPSTSRNSYAASVVEQRGTNKPGPAASRPSYATSVVEQRGTNKPGPAASRPSYAASAVEQRVTSKPLPAKPLPPSPPVARPSIDAPPQLVPSPRKPARESTLERIARELRKIRTRHKSGSSSSSSSSSSIRPQEPDDSNKENRASPTSSNRSSQRSTPPPSPTHSSGKDDKMSEASGGSGDGKGDGKLLRRLKSLRDIKNLSRPQTPAGPAKGDGDDARGRWDIMNQPASSDRKRERSRSRSHSRSRSGRKMHADDEAFDRDEMMRERLIWEAKNGNP